MQQWGSSRSSTCSSGGSSKSSTCEPGQPHVVHWYPLDGMHSLQHWSAKLLLHASHFCDGR
jgi:hypothetical protein